MVAMSQAGHKSRRIFTAGSNHEAATGAIFEVQSVDQLDVVPGAHIEVWAAIEVPPDRVAWADTLRAYEEAGATGVILRWSERLLDLLRNPEPDDRTDLLISTG
jgi:hypothetical protein